MQRLLRLLHYVRPYWLQLLASVLLMAMVGLLEAFRILLVKPVFDRALAPTPHGRGIDLITIPFTHHVISLQQLVPSHFQNDWSMVAYALVTTTIIKGVCDYLGTYLVNYAGFGMITDLRNALYNSVLRRSVGFFGQHSTGSLLSTIINDIERIQFAMSTVLGEFLQQVFTMLFTVLAVISLGGKFAWILLIFIPFIVLSARKIGGRVRQTTRKGQ
jgi:subfamily B ATP-binding cassette protein MsbA